MTFSEQLKNLLDKGLDASKDILSKAGSQAQVWGEMGRLRFEILQLRSKARTLTTRLGAEVYDLLVKQGEPIIGSTTEGISQILKDLQTFDREISEKEGAYRMAGGKDSDLDGDGKPD